MRSRLFPESQTKDCQEIEELRRICCEETDRARQARNPSTVSQVFAQMRDLQNKVNSLSDATEFTVLNQGAAPERPTFPVNPLLFRVPGPCLAAILDCCTIHGILQVLQETFLKGPPAQGGRASTFFEKNPKNLSSSSQELRLDITGTTKRLESEMKREPLKTLILPKWRWNVESYRWNFSHSGMIDYPRFPISELHLRKFITLWNFKAGKSTSR